MNPKQRKFLLFAVLAGMVLAAWFAPEPPEQRVEPRVAAVAPKGAVSGATANATPGKAAMPEPAVTDTLPQRDALGKPKQEIFGFQTWQPPPPPPPKVLAGPPPAPPPPVPPPNPYRFAGRFLQDGQMQVFLTRGEYPVQIKVGDVLEGTYRIEAISPNNIAMTYLPLDYKETIVIPAAGVSAQGGVVPPGANVMSAPRPLVLSPAPPGAASNRVP